MSERLEFIKACLDRSERVVVICDRFGISEKTGQKWLKRFRESGVSGLGDRSHAKLSPSQRIAPEVVDRIVALRKRYPLYGALKLRDWLMLHEPGEQWPAASSIGDLLKRSNLIQTKKRRPGSASREALERSRTRACEPNIVWTADFKGEFRLHRGRGPYCYPLTVMDLHTHFLLGCQALNTTSVAPARRVFTRLFQEYGLPQVMRTDNGVPFAQPNAIGRFGALAFWWVRLGIRPEHIRPARPAENGAHERFHKTLKAAATKPSSDSILSQQNRFDKFRSEYNTERPHQHLPGHTAPARIYTASSRSYPSRLPALIYAEDADLRLVDSSGHIKWRNQVIFLSTNLKGDYVGLTEAANGHFNIAFGPLELGYFDSDTRGFTPRLRWRDQS